MSVQQRLDLASRFRSESAGDGRQLECRAFVGHQLFMLASRCQRQRITKQMQLFKCPAHVHGLGLLWQYAKRPQRARLTQIQLTFLRGVHHDRDHRGARIVLDRRERLETIHARHQMVHEDDIRLCTRQIVEGFLRGRHAVNLQVIALEYAAQKGACRSRVIDNQCPLGAHVLPGGGQTRLACRES